MLEQQTQNSDWQNTLWREVYHCSDQIYAQHLLALLEGNQSPDDEVDAFDYPRTKYGSVLGFAQGVVSVWGFGFVCSLVGSRLSEGWFRGVWGLWCIGILLGVGLSFWLGSTAHLWLPVLRADLPYLLRRLYRLSLARFSDRPYAFEIEAALHTAVAAHPDRGDYWVPLLNRLEQQKKNVPPIRQVLQSWQSSIWSERFLARHTLVAMGAEAVGSLHEVMSSKTMLSPRVAAWILDSIAMKP